MRLKFRIYLIFAILLMLYHNANSLNIEEFKQIIKDNTLFSKNYDNYFIYYFNNNFFRTCIEGKLNIIMKQNISLYPNSLHLIVIAEQNYNDNLLKLYQEYFLTKNIFFDEENEIKNFFFIKYDAELVCLDSNFNILFRDFGFINEPIYKDEFEKVLYKFYNLNVESQYPIVSIDKIIVNNEKNIYLLDKITNSIHVFDLKSGNQLFTFHKEIDFFRNNILKTFNKNKINTLKLYNSRKMNLPLIDNIIFDNSNNNVLFTIKQIKDFIVNNNSYRPLDGIDIYYLQNDGNFKKCDGFDINDSIDEKDIVFKNGNLIYFDANNNYTLFKYEISDKNIMMLYNTSILKRNINEYIGLNNYDFNYAFADKNTFYFLNKNSNIFLKVNVDSNNKPIFKQIKPKGILNYIFTKNKINYELINKYGDDYIINDNYNVKSFLYKDDYLFILLENNSLLGRYNLIIYYEDNFLKEIEINLQSVTDFVNNIKLFYKDNDDLYFMIQWKMKGIEIGLMQFSTILNKNK